MYMYPNYNCPRYIQNLFHLLMIYNLNIFSFLNLIFVCIAHLQYILDTFSQHQNIILRHLYIDNLVRLAHLAVPSIYL